jgi:N-acetylmuramoyl-L-alanine amidase
MNWKYVFVHHSATPDSAELDTPRYRKYHVEANGWKDIGYHYVVEKSGSEYEAICGRRLNLSGAHCPNFNSTAIGVCLAGDFTHVPVPDAQLDVAARLIAGLCDVLDIPTVNVHPHREHRQTECPGKCFSMPELLRRIDAYRRVQ